MCVLGGGNWYLLKLSNLSFHSFCAFWWAEVLGFNVVKFATFFKFMISTFPPRHMKIFSISFTFHCYYWSSINYYNYSGKNCHSLSVQQFDYSDQNIKCAYLLSQEFWFKNIEQRCMCIYIDVQNNIVSLIHSVANQLKGYRYTHVIS